MRKSPRVSAESLFNGALILIALFIIYESLRMGFGSLKKPGSGLFVIFCGSALLILNGSLLIRKSGKRVPSIFKVGEGKKFFAIIVPFFAWILLVHALGYVVVTFLATLSLAKILNLPGWRNPVLLAFGTALSCYVLFDLLLYLDLPRGILG